MAAAAEAGIRFTVVDAETLSLIGFAGDETHAELRSNFLFFSPSLPLSPLQSDVILRKCLQISFSIFI